MGFARGDGSYRRLQLLQDLPNDLLAVEKLAPFCLLQPDRDFPADLKIEKPRPELRKVLGRQFLDGLLQYL